MFDHAMKELHIKLIVKVVCKMFSSRAGYFRWEDHRISSYKGTRGGTAFSISACNDDQSSGDTTVSICKCKYHTSILTLESVIKDSW